MEEKKSHKLLNFFIILVILIVGLVLYSKYIGDSDVDANTIINASIKGILVSYGYRDKELLLKFWLPIVDNVSELEEMINRIK